MRARGGLLLVAATGLRRRFEGVPSVPASVASVFVLSFDFVFLVFFFVGLDVGGSDEVEFKTLFGAERFGSLNERVLGLSCLPELDGESSSAVEAGDKLCTATASLDTSNVPTVADKLICVPEPSDIVSGAVSSVDGVAASTISTLGAVSVVISVDEGVTSAICVESAFSGFCGSLAGRGEIWVSAEVVGEGNTSVAIGTGFSETAGEAETGVESCVVVVAKFSALASADRNGSISRGPTDRLTGEALRAGVSESAPKRIVEVARGIPVLAPGGDLAGPVVSKPYLEGTRGGDFAIDALP